MCAIYDCDVLESNFVLSAECLGVCKNKEVEFGVRIAIRRDFEVDASNREI
jgi:hypothetical protein